MIQTKRLLLAALAASLLLGMAGCATTSPRDVALLVTPRMVESCSGERPETFKTADLIEAYQISCPSPDFAVRVGRAGYLLEPDAERNARVLALESGQALLAATLLGSVDPTEIEDPEDLEPFLSKIESERFPDVGSQAIYYSSSVGFDADRLEFTTSDGKFDVRIIGSDNIVTFSEPMVNIKQLARALSDQYDATYP